MDRWEGLEEVVAIADAGSFVGGAKILSVSTSHISKVVARLEARLSAPLFNRTTRRVHLTEVGRILVEQSRRIIQEREELLSLASGQKEPEGELRITCSTALGERFVAPIVRRFTNDHPRLSVSLDLNNRIVDVVGEGYDVGIRTGQVADTRLVGRQIAKRSLAVCASPGYLEAAGTPAVVGDLDQHQCLVGISATWQFLERGAPRLFKPHGRWTCNSGAAVVDAALAGMGICQLPEFYVRQHLEAGLLRPVLQDYRSEPEPVWAVYPYRRHLVAKVRKFVDLLCDDLQTAIEHG